MRRFEILYLVIAISAALYLGYKAFGARGRSWTKFEKGDALAVFGMLILSVSNVIPWPEVARVSGSAVGTAIVVLGSFMIWKARRVQLND